MIIELREYDTGISKESVPWGIRDQEVFPDQDIFSLFWRFYKKVLTFPVGSKGFDRRIGILLYFLSLALAIASIFLIQSKQSRHYTATKLEHYGEFTDFETPDVIICPYFDQPLQKYEFNVKYNEQLIQKLGMTTSDVNELTRIKFDACKDGNNCKIPERECNGPLRNLTETIVGIMEETNSTLPYGLDLHPLNGHLTLSKLKCNLELLWKLIIDPSYYITTIEEKEYSDLSWVQGYMFSDKNMWLINNLTHPVWVRKTLCAHFPSISVGNVGTEGEYIVFNFRSKPVHVNYWIGSLAYQKVGPFLQNFNLSNSNESNIAANYLRYSLTEMVDQTEKERVCKSDENRKILRGLSPSCDVTFDAKAARFYEWNIAEGFSENSNIVVIKRFSKLTIVKKATLTNYSRFQLTANLVACFVGHSAMQIIFAFFEIYQKNFHLKFKVESMLKLSVLLILVAATCSMGYIDLKFYFDQRYNSVYVQKKVSLPDPIFELNKMEIQSSGYINVTKFKELNISFEFYAFMRHVAFYSDRVIASASKTNETYDEKGDCKKIIEFPDWTSVTNISHTFGCSENISPRNLLDPLYGALTDFKDLVDALKGYEGAERLDLTLNQEVSESLRTEALTVSRNLGLDFEATIAQLVRHFSLDPKQFATCSFGNRPFDCSEYWVIYRTLSDHNLALRLPMGLRESLFPRNSPDSVENALKISIDTRKFHTHSDLNLYLGPGDSRNISAPSWYACQQPLKPGWKMEGCGSTHHWGVQLLYPDSWIAGAERMLSHTGIFPTGKHRIDLRISFDEKLEQSDKSDCVSTQYERPCKHPQEDINTVFLAVQLHHWCGCINCLVQGESEFSLSEVQRIIDGPTSCCTTSILTSCYTSYLANIQKPNKTVAEKSRMVLSTLYHGITSSSISNLYRDWWKADEVLLRKTIHGYDYFSSDVKERLIEFAQKCFATPCKKYSVHLNNYFVEDLDDGFLNFTIFYGDSDASGTEEEDRFQVADFFGVLTCSFSFTFGIGLVGLCEIILTFCNQKRRGSKLAMSLLKQKLERSLGVWTEIRGSKPASPTETKTVETSAARETILRASKPPMNCDYSMSETIQQSFETPTNEPEVTDNTFEETSKANGGGERLLVIVFSFSAALMAVTIASFFASTKGNEFNADVLSGPMIRQPSIILCVEFSAAAIRLWSSLKSSHCQASNLYIESEKPCSEYFTTFFRNRKDEFCFMFDRTRSPEIQLGQVTADFIMHVPADFPEVTYAIEGFAKRRSVAELAPFLKSTNFSIQIPYDVKITKIESDCEDMASDISLEKCGVDFTKKPYHSICSLSNGTHLIPMVLEDSCTNYEYRFSISKFRQNFQSSSNFTKSFIVKSVYEFAIETKVKKKYDNLMLLSIVGGFVGSFIELTIFNCLSMIFLITKTMMFCTKKIWKK